MDADSEDDFDDFDRAFEADPVVEETEPEVEENDAE